jgi:hypothetical protein
MEVEKMQAREKVELVVWPPASLSFQEDQLLGV